MLPGQIIIPLFSTGSFYLAPPQYLRGETLKTPKNHAHPLD